MIKQGDIVTINFDPSKGSEIKKRRLALVISRDEYNLSSNLIIVCPITSTQKKTTLFCFYK
ncbi:PemK-like, MazF-like toxin of type II toxin-antitoxin system [Isobaculum melis]|uniref:PemK-like, MazF-like toxin of type II toxin-antitoxin system n=1 Tax=Isobaculum melis TaxID=142588 RepID=A0A1H9SQP7_9LACT|nr:PemK-like, MazF-like toxin of type II toxin-antitoxin system [Isobaculum melis]